MVCRMSKQRRKEAFFVAAGEMYDELEMWYDAHPEATFGEIEEEARRRRRDLMGKALEILVNGRDTGYQMEGVQCVHCGRWMEYKGESFKRTIYSYEGDVSLERAYYVCPVCEGETVFPPRQEAGIKRGSLE